MIVDRIRQLDENGGGDEDDEDDEYIKYIINFLLLLYNI